MKKFLKSDQLQSPSKPSVHLELPSKSAITVNTVATSSKFSGSGNFTRKSPKRRPARYTPSSSSSTESLTASSNTKDTSMPSIKCNEIIIQYVILLKLPPFTSFKCFSLTPHLSVCLPRIFISIILLKVPYIHQNSFTVRDSLIESLESGQYGNVPDDSDKVSHKLKLVES